MLNLCCNGNCREKHQRFLFQGDAYIIGSGLELDKRQNSKSKSETVWGESTEHWPLHVGQHELFRPDLTL